MKRDYHANPTFAFVDFVVSNARSIIVHLISNGSKTKFELFVEWIINHHAGNITPPVKVALEQLAEGPLINDVNEFLNTEFKLIRFSSKNYYQLVYVESVVGQSDIAELQRQLHNGRFREINGLEGSMLRRRNRLNDAYIEEERSKEEQKRCSEQPIELPTDLEKLMTYRLNNSATYSGSPRSLKMRLDDANPPGTSSERSNPSRTRWPSLAKSDSKPIKLFSQKAESSLSSNINDKVNVARNDPRPHSTSFNCRLQSSVCLAGSSASKNFDLSHFRVSDPSVVSLRDHNTQRKDNDPEKPKSVNTSYTATYSHEFQRFHIATQSQWSKAKTSDQFTEIDSTPYQATTPLVATALGQMSSSSSRKTQNTPTKTNTQAGIPNVPDIPPSQSIHIVKNHIVQLYEPKLEKQAARKNSHVRENGYSYGITSAPKHLAKPSPLQECVITHKRVTFKMLNDTLSTPNTESLSAERKLEIEELRISQSRKNQRSLDKREDRAEYDVIRGAMREDSLASHERYNVFANNTSQDQYSGDDVLWSSTADLLGVQNRICGSCSICVHLIYEAHETISCGLCEIQFHAKCYAERAIHRPFCPNCSTLLVTDINPFK